MKLHFPSGKELSNAYGGAWGREVKAEGGDSDIIAAVDDGNTATPARIQQAARQWPQARPEDFERVGRNGFRDLASGTEYKVVPGAVLLGVGSEAVRNISTFFVSDGRLTFLRRADIDPVLTVYHGEVIGREVTPTHAVGSGLL